MNNILKMVKSLEDSGLLLERVSERIKNEAKKQKGGFLSMILGTLGRVYWEICWQARVL